MQVDDKYSPPKIIMRDKICLANNRNIPPRILILKFEEDMSTNQKLSNHHHKLKFTNKKQFTKLLLKHIAPTFQNFPTSPRSKTTQESLTDSTSINGKLQFSKECPLTDRTCILLDYRKVNIVCH